MAVIQRLEITESDEEDEFLPPFQFSVSRGEDFVTDLELQEKNRPSPLRAGFSDEEILSLRRKIKERRASPERIEKDRAREEQRRRYRRDGIPISSDEFKGFHAYERAAEAGDRKILWGKCLLNNGCEFHVLTIDRNGPCQHLLLNRGVTNGWISNDSDCFAIEILNDESPENRRSIYLIFDAQGQLTRKFEPPRKWVTFLGISETGTHYLWNFKGWLHVTSSDCGVDFLNRKLPDGFNPNVAALDSERSVIKLIAHGGTRMEISWEDCVEGHFPHLATKLEAAEERYRSEIIREEWESRPEPDKHVAEFLLPWVRTVTRQNLGEDSDFNWIMGWKEFLALRREIEVASGDAEGAANSIREIDEYLQPFDTVNTARTAVPDAIKQKDDNKITQLAMALNDAIETKKLEPYPHLLAKCFRYLGEIAQHNGDLRLAISFYTQAVTLDEAVGCKRNLKKVEKELSRTE